MQLTAIDSSALRVVAAIAHAGGRALAVGGCVRDAMLGIASKDVDFEVYGLTIAELEAVLGTFGEVIKVGRAFGVLRVKTYDIDFSIPRRDSKTGKGHRGFLVELDPNLTFADAARRRDLTINSIGFDPLTKEILDPHGGQRDLDAGILRATDPEHFSEDPLRALRVSQFAARFEMEADEELARICAALDLDELAPERVWGEMHKLLSKGLKPSVGFEFLRTTDLIRFFPELAALIDVPQDPRWHPEGPVWDHTMMVIDEAARDRSDDAHADLVLRLGALCHDLGKPSVTEIRDGRVKAHGHEAAGVAPTQAFLHRMRAPKDLTSQVACAVRYHLAPAHLPGHATDKAYRRLARKLAAGGLNAEALYRLARADCFGRTTEDAIARRFPAGDQFLADMRALDVHVAPSPDAVLGRHLIARGLQPGPAFGSVLEACREVQDETGWHDPERILTTVLTDGVDSESEDD